MATYMAVRRAPFTAKLIFNSTSRRLNFNCNSCKNISTSAAVAYNRNVAVDVNHGEQSWVRKMLYGSGPSADINEQEEDTDEDDDKFVKTVEEARYMDVIQTPTVINRPEVRKRVYRPPSDVSELLKDITMESCQGTAEADWQHVALTDNQVKYKILSKCSQTLQHSVPNFLLNQMKTMSDVAAFYQIEVKDTSKFDELSTQELPANLRIHWDYKDDSKLEIYEDYLEYVKPKFQVKPKDIPKIRYR